MTSTIVDTLLVVSASPVAMVLAKATILMAAALGALRLTPAVRASRRALMLVFLFAAMAALPVASARPALRIPVRQAPPPPVQRLVTEPAVEAPPLMVPDAGAVAPAPSSHGQSGGAAKRWEMPSAPALLTIAWAIGCLLVSIPVVNAIREVRMLRRTGQEWPEGEAVVRSVAAGSVKRPIWLLLNGQVDAPVTFGTWRPAIVLPDEAPQWSTEDLERALVHEMEHIRRYDWPAHILARLVCALYWFHPLIWICWRRLHVEADRACDDAVVSRSNGDAFARQLVTLAGRMSSQAALTIPAMASPGDLSVRVRALLDAGQARGRAGRMWAAAAASLCAIGAGLVAPLVAVENSARAPQAPATVATERFATVSITRSWSPDADPDQRRALRGGGSVQIYGDRNTLYASNVTLDDLLRWAYGIGGAALVGYREVARPWSSVEGLRQRLELYEVRAQGFEPLPETPPGTIGPMHLMTQALLAERFGVLVHWEQRTRPFYVLTRTGNPGPQLRWTSRSDCNATTPRRPRPLSPAELGVVARALPCGSFALPAYNGFTAVPGTRELVGRRQTLDEFARTLQREIGRQVMNGTNLNGTFDIDLRYFRDPRMEDEAAVTQIGSRWLLSRTPRAPAPPPGPEWPPLDVALREQLGLVLEPHDTIEEVLVVDRAERPVLDQP